MALFTTDSFFCLSSSLFCHAKLITQLTHFIVVRHIHFQAETSWSGNHIRFQAETSLLIQYLIHPVHWLHTHFYRVTYNHQGSDRIKWIVTWWKIMSIIGPMMVGFHITNNLRAEGQPNQYAYYFKSERIMRPWKDLNGARLCSSTESSPQNQNQKHLY